MEDRTHAQIQSDGIQKALDEKTRLVKEGRVSDTDALRAANVTILGNIAVQLAGIRDELAKLTAPQEMSVTNNLLLHPLAEAFRSIDEGIEAIPNQPAEPEAGQLSEALEDVHTDSLITSELPAPEETETQESA